MPDLFLKIIKGEIPSAKVYEDEHTYAFLDINPINKGHTLVVPKADFGGTIFDTSEETFLHMARAVHRVARAVRSGTGADGVNIVMNNGAAADQDMLTHAHVHVIPRFVHDHVFQKSAHNPYVDDGERFALAEKIAAEFK